MKVSMAPALTIKTKPREQPEPVFKLGGLKNESENPVENDSDTPVVAGSRRQSYDFGKPKAWGTRADLGKTSSFLEAASMSATARYVIWLGSLAWCFIMVGGVKAANRPVSFGPAVGNFMIVLCMGLFVFEPIFLFLRKKKAPSHAAQDFDGGYSQTGRKSSISVSLNPGA